MKLFRPASLSAETIRTRQTQAAEPIKLVPQQFELKNVLPQDLDSRINASVASANQTKNRSSADIFSPAPPVVKPTGEKISAKDALNSISKASGVFEVQESLDALEDEASPSFKVSKIARQPIFGFNNRSRFSPLPLNLIWGTPGADDITGTGQTDFINGLSGNDTIRGANGDDIIFGGSGDDIISGDHVPSQTTQSNDIIFGGSGADKLFGRIGEDRLLGGNGDDQIFGGSGRDRLSGGNGDDQLFGGIVPGDASFNPDPDARDVLAGGKGNDYLDGGLGDDYLNGSSNAAKGAGEIDLLTGGLGNDTFVLGTSAGAYYIQGGASQDFAIVLDFEQGDRVRLNGDSSQYVLAYDATEGSTALGYLGSGNFELVGVFADVDLSNTSLDSSAFQYV